MKSKNSIKKISLYLLSSLLIIAVVCLIIFKALDVKATPFKGSNGHYVNEQSSIIPYNTPTEDNSVDLSTLYRLNNKETGEIVKIATPEAGVDININTAIDLYAFSVLANQNPEFLTYNYQLLSNINYDDSKYAFIPVAFRPDMEFTGQFNGNGFEISNLDLINIRTKNDKDTLAGIKYFAMFSKLGANARVTNLGLRDTNIVINYVIEDMAVSALVGKIAPGATVSYCFATDLRDPVIDEAGITASGGYRISGLVYENDGVLENSYTAYSSVSNYTVTDYTDFSEILTINHGTINNLFFYNSTIKSYKEENGKITIEYKTPIDRIFELNSHEGSYVRTIEELNSSVLASTNSWYTKDSYSDLAKYLTDIVTPITRGLKLLKNDSGYHFTIKSELDFGYMFELMNHNARFATEDMIYEINNDLFLNKISPNNYSYTKSIGATIVGIEIPSGGSASLADGSKSKYPTIYNPSLTNRTITEGINAYGLFPWLTGSVSNLNIVVDHRKTTTITVDSVSSDSGNIKAFGLLSGYANGATITNVNVFGNITFDNSIGKYYVGGAIGILSGLSNLTNVTTNGIIIANDSLVSNYSDPTGYMKGNSIGGAVGYIDRTYGSLNEVLSEVDINVLANNNNSVLMVGGVIGSGYIANLDGIENRGAITLGSGTNSLSYNTIYVGGAIGRALGVRSQIQNINNKGNIDVYLKANKTGYISGILNADIITSANQYLDASYLKNQGKYVFYASSLINQADVIIHNKLNNVGYTHGINVLATNGFNTIISGAYNLKLNNEAIHIDMEIINEYAPVVNIESNSNASSSELDTIYNLRNIEFVANNALINADYNYSGVIRGRYVSLIDISNEGNISVRLNSNASSSNSNLIINGVFSELNLGMSANNIFNGGDISVNSLSTNIGFNVYASGITYTNDAILSDNKYNPLKNEFDSNSVGSINNAINNGNIRIYSEAIQNASETLVNENLNSYINGKSFASGIVAFNKGIISNSFNLGDIEIFLASNTEIHSQGISYLNDGAFAQIRDSANNGVIKAINVGNFTPIVHASGVTGNNISNDLNAKQVIAFTINYGEIYAFSTENNNDVIDSNEHVKAGGLLANGICNLVNTINYGNVFSTNTAGGILGAFTLTSGMEKAIIANTLNYGIVKAINSYETVNGEPSFAKIGEIDTIAPSSKYIAIGQTASPFYQSIGALIGVADYGGFDKVNIRYLVNFFEGVLIVSKELNVPSGINTDAVKRLYNVSPNNRFLGQSVTYAPLSTISDSDGNIGVFSPEFGFRKAMEGIGLDPNEITDKYIGDFFNFIGFEKINDVILDKIGWNQIAYMDAAERFAKDLKSVVNLLNLPNVNKNNTILDEALASTSWINKANSEIIANLLNEVLNGGLSEAELNILLEFALFEAPSSNFIAKELRDNLVEKIYDNLAKNKSAYEILNSLLYDELLAKIIANSNQDYKDIALEIRRIISTSDNLDGILDAYIDELRNPDSSLVDPLFSPMYENYYYEAKLKLLNTLLNGYSDNQIKSLLNLIDNGEYDLQSIYLKYLEENNLASSEIYTSMIAANEISNNAYLSIMNQSFKRYGASKIITDALNDANGDAIVKRFTDELAKHNENTVASITSLNQTSVRDYVDLWNLIKNDSYITEYLNIILGDVISVDGESGKGIYAKATEYTNTYQSNDGPSDINSNTGKLRATDVSSVINTRFIFTPDKAVSNLTHYYGPYKTTSNDIWYPGADSDNYNKGFNLYTTGKDQAEGASVRYVPFFATLDQAELDKRGAIHSYDFLWSNVKTDSYKGDSSNQWVSYHILGKKPTDATSYLIKDKRKQEYIDNGYYDFNNVTRTSSYESTTKNFKVGNHQLYLASSTADMNLNTFPEKHNYSDQYLVAKISADLITGIWYQQNIWKDDGVLQGAYLTAKSNTPYTAQREGYTGDYYGVQTTEYINYFISDLIKLDGILTKGKGNNAESLDEKKIINELMTTILSTPEGQRTVLNALAKESEKGLTADDALALDLIEASLNKTTFVNGVIKDLTYDIDTLNKVKYNSSQTIKQYLDSKVNLNLNDKDKLIALAVRNKASFIKLIVETYDRAKASLSKDIPITKINNFVYEMIIKNPNLTGNEINDLLLMVNDTDLANIVKLYQHLLPEQYTLDGFTFNGLFAYNSLSGSYPYEITALDDTSTITFNSTEASLIIAFKGTIRVNGQEYVNTQVSKKTININNGANTIELNNGSSVYSLETNTIGSKIGESAYYSGNVTLKKGATYNGDYVLTKESGTAGSIKIDVRSLNGLDVKLNFKGAKSKVEITDTNGLTIDYKKNGMDITNKSPITITTNSNKTTISDLYIEYSGKVGAINYTITQYLVPQGKTPKQPTTAFVTSQSLDNASYSMGNSERASINLKGEGTSSGARINDVTGVISFYNPDSGIAATFDNISSQVVANVEVEFNALNTVAKEIAIKGMTEAVVTNKQFSINKPAYVFVEATSAGDINLNGIDKAVIPELKYYAYYLPSAKTYTISGSASIGKVYIMYNDTAIARSNNGNTDILTVGSETGAKNILEFDYSSLNTFEADVLTPLFNGNDKYSQFEAIYDLRQGLDKQNLRKNDQVELIMTLFSTMKSGPNHETNPNEWILFLPNTTIPEEQRIFKKADLINLAKMIAKADFNNRGSALDKLISQYNDVAGIKEIIKSLAKTKGMSVDLIIKLQEIVNSNNNEGLKDLFKAAYIGDDFIYKFNTYKMTESKLYTLISTLGDDYKFIVGDYEINTNSFINLMKKIGFDSNTDGYGIYALSSSKGILNGSYIPDNVALSTLDKYYNSNLELTTTKTPAWRGGNDINPNEASLGSVNKGVLVEMKQLVKSISTTIFELNLVDSTGTIHHSSESSIDLENKIITYYVPTGYIAGLDDKSLEISGNVSLANNATFKLKDNLVIDNNPITNGIIVTAEDVTVVSSYTIIFKEINISFSLKYMDNSLSKNVEASGGRIELKVESVNNNLPLNMGLEAFIVLKNQNGDVIDKDLAYTLTKKDGNAIVDSNGMATITLDIKPNLPYGDYKLYLDIFGGKGGSVQSVDLIKNPSSLASIDSFIYEGNNLLFSYIVDHYEAESEIEFGRAFDFEELTNINSKDFYLNDLAYSSGATITTEASYEVIDNLMTYSVTYTVTAENGNSNIYIHRLHEKAPFVAGSSYATVYVDGANSEIMTYDSVNLDNNIINKSFNRGLEPQFSVKYTLASFYLADSLNISYEVVEDLNNMPGSAIIDIYSGMMVTITAAQDPGVYVYNYVYRSKGSWNNGEYVREYSFPALRITKNYSVDSSLKKITFIDSFEVVGSLATIMDPTAVIRPNVSNLNPNEINYEDVTDQNRKIKIEKGNIDYLGYDRGYKDYYTVGTISNATLETYNPTFKLEEHAEIYLTTSLEKLRYYGANQGSKTDMQILSNHDTSYIYVPFTGSDGSEVVYLVEIVNGNWTKVYLSSFTGTAEEIAAPIANLNGGESFDYNGITYTKSQYAGLPVKENIGLQADYIGAPQEGHFWYISYVVFSEDYLNSKGSMNNNLTYYHVALIDQTNTVYFDILLKAPASLGLDTIFITLAYNQYDALNNKTSNQISGYVSDRFDDLSTAEIEYMMETQLQILPNGYYYFLVDLPAGYKATARVTNGRNNRNQNENEPGAYLPPASIVTQRVSIEITVEKDTTSLGGSWGVSVGDIGTKVAIFN